MTGPQKSAAPSAWRLWIPGPLPGLNELIAAAKGAGGKGMLYAGLKKKWTADIALLATVTVRKHGPIPEPAMFRFCWVEKTKRRDKDNVAAGGRKLILDGLVKAKALKDDSWQSVFGWSDVFALDTEPGCLVTALRLEDLGHGLAQPGEGGGRGN